eukprot:Gb_34231 [translate_table: standard]
MRKQAFKLHNHPACWFKQLQDSLPCPHYAYTAIIAVYVDHISTRHFRKELHCFLNRPIFCILTLIACHDTALPFRYFVKQVARPVHTMQLTFHSGLSCLLYLTLKLQGLLNITKLRVSNIIINLLQYNPIFNTFSSQNKDIKTITNRHFHTSLRETCWEKIAEALL